MRRTLALSVLVVVFSSLLGAQTGFRLKTRNAGELYAEQRRVVGTWCRQDFEGLRLAADSWDRFKPLSTFRTNPEFNSIVIVSRFQVEPRDTISWEMSVDYVVIGKYERGSGYLADPGTETVTFQTKDIEGDIVITSLDPSSPHVSKKAAIAWMKNELATTTSDVEKAHLRDALKILDTPPTTTPESSK